MFVNIALTSYHWQRPYFVYYSTCMLDKKFEFLKLNKLLKYLNEVLKICLRRWRATVCQIILMIATPLKKSWLLQRLATI